MRSLREQLEDPAACSVREGEQQLFPSFLIRNDTYHYREITYVFSGPLSSDEFDFRRSVEEHRSELHAHCYRMLGSFQDAEDASQETFLRAWRGLPQFEARSSIRTGLHTIATNVCLSAIARRPKRTLPTDSGEASPPTHDPGQPLVETELVQAYVEAWQRGEVGAVATGGPMRLASQGWEEAGDRYEVEVFGGASELSIDERRQAVSRYPRT